MTAELRGDVRASRDDPEPALPRVRYGARGRFFNVVDLVSRLEIDTRAGRQGCIADRLIRLDFVVLDERGYLPSAQAGWRLLLHLVSRLYERTSTRRS